MEAWGDDVDFEAPPIIKLQLSLPASRPDPPSASAAFCRSLFEAVSGRSSHWMWFMRTLSSRHIVHRRQPFLLPPLWNIHTLPSRRATGDLLTQMLRKLWFRWNHLSGLSKLKNAQHLRLRRISDATHLFLLVESVPRSDRGLAFSLSSFLLLNCDY